MGNKTEAGNIELTIRQMLDTGIPQLARTIHDEIDRTAGGFLWDFSPNRDSYGPKARSILMFSNA